MLNLFFPKICQACRYPLSDGEITVCTRCRHQLPLTNFHFTDDPAVKNAVYGRVDLMNATALLHFSKRGLVQELIHNLKYRGQEEVGEFLGKWLGAELAELDSYKNIDCVVPVPLHKSRLRTRGYNQVAKLGQEIATALNANYDDRLLIKSFATKTQVFKDRIGRSNPSEAQFSITDGHKYQHKHLLLVDDLITTGATVESCARVLQEIPGVQLSLATMAITD